MKTAAGPGAAAEAAVEEGLTGGQRSARSGRRDLPPSIRVRVPELLQVRDGLTGIRLVPAPVQVLIAELNDEVARLPSLAADDETTRVKSGLLAAHESTVMALRTRAGIR